MEGGKEEVGGGKADVGRSKSGGQGWEEEDREEKGNVGRGPKGSLERVVGYLERGEREREEARTKERERREIKWRMEEEREKVQAGRRQATGSETY